MIFLVKNHPNLKAPVVRPNPDLCGIYRVFVPPYTFDRVEARQDARSERLGCRGLGFRVQEITTPRGRLMVVGA